jgi:hypothetical protein
LVCVLLALSLLFHGAIAGSLLLMFGAALLAGWAIWLAGH